MRQVGLGATLSAAMVVLAGCSPHQAVTPAQVGLANPASVFCEDNGGQLELRTGPGGGVTGVCVFPDGSECEEWAYFRSECRPGEGVVTPRAEPTSAPTPVPPPAGWQVYHNASVGYSFSYPADATIEADDNPAHSITVVGPEEDGERWPQITISHPADLPEFRPPEGVDLAAWLTDHSMLGDTRLPDLEIAGIRAIHLSKILAPWAGRQERSPQSYAYERYYFARGGQLYMLVIGHTGNREDWDLYNRFLESYQFD